MTPCGESQKEATRSTRLPVSRIPLNIGTWNVRTMYQTGKANEIVDEMCKYNLLILGVSESRWTSSGESHCQEHLILFSGHDHENAAHTEGVALILDKKAKRSLIKWEAHGSRLICATFRTNHKKKVLNIVQCYAPTNDAEYQQKKEFYERLNSLLSTFSEKDLTLLMGDFNAKIGTDNTGYEDIMGEHGTGEMNENGELFANMCSQNKFVIGGSIFPHKMIHKTTWMSPDCTTQNQIDHICINKKFRRSLLDTRAKRGADVGSDHHLLCSKIKMKLMSNWTIKGNKNRFNTNTLKEQSTQDLFKITLSNKFQILSEPQSEEMSAETYWNEAKCILTSTCENVLGKRTQQHKQWITQDSINKINERKRLKHTLVNCKTRNSKANALTNYNEKAKEVKKSLKNDKRRYVDTLAEEAEQAAGSGNMQKLYSISKQLSGKYNKSEKPVKDKNGKSISGVEEQMDRWVEHFEQLLNRASPTDPPDIDIPPPNPNINCERPSRLEILKAVKSLHNGKAPGPDNIPPEALKADINTTVEMMHVLFGKVWESEEIPTDWKESHIVKIPKKGDLSNCNNYRGISLLSIPGKVFNRVILERIRDATDPQLRDQQAGFRRNRSCSDQIATLRIIVEQSLEWKSPLYINFIDYEKAFDSLDRATLWKLLGHYGLPIKIINLIKNTYEGATCKVIHKGQLTKPFSVGTGVKQGCLLSPFLFILAIDWIMKTVTKNRKNGIQWTMWKHLEDLDFADDLALLSHNSHQMQDKTTALYNVSRQLGLNIHKGKTKVMRLNTESTDKIKLNGEDLGDIDKFIYLGSNIDKDGGADNDIKIRIGKARNIFHQLRNIWSSRIISTATKLRLFNSNVKSVLLYSSESWKLTKTNTHRIQTFVNNCLRKILHINWPDTISNIDLWARTNQCPVEMEIGRRRWRWLGHTLRKDKEHTTRQSLSWNPQGKRGRGRPKSSWRRDLQADIKRSGLSWKETEKMALDRRKWRSHVDGLYPTRGPKDK